MKKTLEIRQKIIDYLVHFKLRIETNNRLGLYDVNKLSQGFIASLLNIINEDSDSDYVDLDKIKPNYPAIDLGCKKQKVAYQVTSQKDTTKIYDTIASFKEKYFDISEFDTLRFVILNNLNWSTKQWENIEKNFTENGLTFSDNSVLTIEELEKELAVKDEDILTNFLTKLQDEFGRIEHNQHKKEDKSDKDRKEFMSKIHHVYIPSWQYAESAEELEFKKLLKGKDSISCNLLAKGKHQEILELWTPLERFDLYQINHSFWLDKPFFRRYIQAAKMDACLARLAICVVSQEKCDLDNAIEILREVLFAPTYSITGGSKTQLPIEAAKHENNETILFLNRVIEIFQRLIEIWSDYLIHKFNVDAFTLDGLIEECQHKVALIKSVNE